MAISNQTSGEFPNCQALHDDGKKYDAIGDGNKAFAEHGGRDGQGKRNG